MEKSIKYLLAFIFISFNYLLVAQKINENSKLHATIDSLESFFKITSSDTSKIITLNKLRKTYINLNDYNTALKYALKSKEIAEKMNDKKRIARAYFLIGDVYNDEGNYEMAFNNLITSLKILEELGDKGGMADSYIEIGNIYESELNHDKALEVFFKALKLYEQTNDKFGIANSYTDIGIIYEDQKNYAQALEQSFNALKIYEDIGNQVGAAACYNNIGLLYMEQKNYQKGLFNYLKASKIHEDMNDKQGMGLVYNNIGDAYTRMGKFEEAEHFLNLALTNSTEAKSKDDIKEAYLSLSQLYSTTGDYKKAFENQKLFCDIKDTLLNEESNKHITEMDAKYESEKKEKNIELLTKDKAVQNADLNKQKLIRNSVIGGLIVALILALIFYSRYQIKQKLYNKLSNKNEELLQKNTLIEKQKEKIIDSITYAQRIQQSILMEVDEMKKFFNDFFIFYQPKDIVSGDFYWSSKVNDKTILAAIDCTGHGVPGAFMSMIGNTLLNQIVNENHITKPSEILRLLNIGIYEALHQQKESALSRDGMDMALCTIDNKEGLLEFAGAQNPLYILSDNAVEVIKGDKQTIGGGGLISQKLAPLKREYANHIVPIKKGMCIYLFSDGYMDQFGGSERKKFGVQQFKELLLNNQQFSMQKQQEMVIKAHEDWKGNLLQVDDILVIGVRL